VNLDRTPYVCVLAGEHVADSRRKLYGQGCIVARSSSSIGGRETEGGYLAPGEFNFSIGLRYQFSFRHFVGDVEQKQRIQMGNQVMNKINLLNFDLNYQVSRRFSFQIDARCSLPADDRLIRHTQRRPRVSETLSFRRRAGSGILRRIRKACRVHYRRDCYRRAETMSSLPWTSWMVKDP